LKNAYGRRFSFTNVKGTEQNLLVKLGNYFIQYTE